MKVSKECIELIKHHEGVRTRPYRCPAALWTVGVGHVIDPNHIRIPFDERKGLAIPSGWDRALSLAEVDDILAKDLVTFERGVLRLCPTGLTQSRFDAFVCFSFNAGLGGLQRSPMRLRHNRGDYEGAAEAWLDCRVTAGGKILPGLVKRRKDESTLYLKADKHS